MSRPATSPMAWPTGRGAGEAHHVDVRRRDERLARLGAEPVTTLTTPGGEAGVVEDLAEHGDGERVLRRRLHDDGVAHRERRADLAGHVHDREVVRRDARDDADRLAHDHRAHQPAGRQRGGRHLARRQRDRGRLERALGVAAEPLDARRHLHGRRDALRGAGLGLHQRDELVHPIAQEVGGLVRAARRAPRASCGSTPGRRRPPRRPPRPGRPMPRAPRRPRLGGRVDDLVAAASPSTRSPPMRSWYPRHARTRSRPTGLADHHGDVASVRFW